MPAQQRGTLPLINLKPAMIPQTTELSTFRVRRPLGGKS